MSAAKSQTPMESKLEALQCHFTWGINLSRATLFRFTDKLEDIVADEGNSWLGHIYNLQGFIHYKLGLTEDAQSFFSRAAEGFHQMRKAASDEGPWLMVNYGNQAWLHHHLGQEAESQAYLSKVDALMNKYPSPSQEELHPEIYAEKAWTLMKFSRYTKALVVDYFERAIRMQPDMVEWGTSHTLALLHGFSDGNTGSHTDILEKIRKAKEQHPENLYLAVQYLNQLAKKGENIKHEARELAIKVLRNPVSSYSGMKALLMVFMKYISANEAIDLAEEALKQHPDERYLKRCVALCYKWRIIYFRDSQSSDKSMIDRAIILHKEVISLYPHSSLVKKIDLANIYAKSKDGLEQAERMYQELLESDLEPADRQMLYNHYAKYLNFDQHDV
ncbi:interferon-induced protein with tetratricopeptide repeats 5-like isoform X2 [Channa argus]|uniref:interferon-induced protein with tetratricopeptide repeats 5-like isoform X2 n=1 Tax=Channa argus TaxID=215402 RepID=UPI0035216BCE